MFTGTVGGLGLLRERRGSVLVIEVPPAFYGRLAVGASIAVNGVCLTVRELSDGALLADLSWETASCTTLGAMRLRSRVNLELPVSPQEGLDGHIVLGHIDTVGRTTALRREREGWRLIISYPPEFRRYLVEKGSVAVDGISLTPFDTTGATFCCAVIPETFTATNLQDRAVGDPVNIEFDILAKYVERMMGHVHTD